MTITFIDSGVLVAASRGIDDLSDKAISILASADREFASSAFIKLEVLPKATYYRQTDEVEFYQTFFSAVTYWANDTEQVIKDGYDISCKYGLAAMDALLSLFLLATKLQNQQELLTLRLSQSIMTFCSCFSKLQSFGCCFLLNQGAPSLIQYLRYMDVSSEPYSQPQQLQIPNE